MNGIDGWTHDADASSYSLDRDGTGSLVYTAAGAADDFSGAITHAIDPLDTSLGWSLQLTAVCPTTPFQNLILQMQIGDNPPTAWITMYLQGHNDGTPPGLVVADSNGYSLEVPVNPGYDASTVWKAVFDGVNVLRFLQDDVELTSVFPFASVAMTAQKVVIFWKCNREDLPAARLTDVAVAQH